MKKWVLHINSYLKDRTFYKGFFDEQIKKGLNIKVYTPVPYGRRGKADTVGNYVDVEECYFALERFFFFIKQGKALKRAEMLYDFSNCQVIHAHSMCTNGYIAYRLSKKFNIPYIITIRNGDLNNIYKKAIYLRKIFNNIINNASAIIFLSKPYMIDVLENCVPMDVRNNIQNKCYVVPNGIDNFWIDNKFEKKRKLHKPVRLIYAGEINQNKNVIGILGAMKHLKETGIETKLVAVGPIKDKSLQSLLRKNNVDYRGVVSKEQLLNLYRESDIFVMPSHKEAFGLVYAEAISQGLPVIYTKNQGFDMQFSEGTVGFHVDSKNEKNIADKIYDIIHDFNRMTDGIAEYSRKFRWSDLVDIYEEIYNSTIGKKPNF